MAGERISQLPLEPQYGRVLLEAAELGCVSEALILVLARWGQILISATSMGVS